MKYFDVSFILSLFLLFFGVIFTLFSIGQISIFSPNLDWIQLTDKHKKDNLPWELFKFSLFTVALGSLMLVYRSISDIINSNQERRRREADVAKQLRENLVEIHGRVKTFRRELRARGVFSPEAPLIVSKADFFCLLSDYNKVQHSLESVVWNFQMSKHYFGSEYKEIKKYIDNLESYTHDLLDDGSCFHNLDDGDITIGPGNKIFEFVQPIGERSIDEDFDAPDKGFIREYLIPMKHLRRRLKKRYEKLGI